MTSPLYKSAAGERAVMAHYAEVLAHWPVPHERIIIGTRHGDTFVIVSGEPTAPPLVLLQRLSMPTLLVAGARDAIRTTDKLVARMQRQVADLSVAVLPEMGHVLVGTTALTVPFLTGARPAQY